MWHKDISFVSRSLLPAGRDEGFCFVPSRKSVPSPVVIRSLVDCREPLRWFATPRLKSIFIRFSLQVHHSRHRWHTRATRNAASVMRSAVAFVVINLHVPSPFSDAATNARQMAWARDKSFARPKRFSLLGCCDPIVTVCLIAVPSMT